MAGPHVARKRFGQHFLTDLGVVDEIVAAIRRGDDRTAAARGVVLRAIDEAQHAATAR